VGTTPYYTDFSCVNNCPVVGYKYLLENYTCINVSYCPTINNE